MRVSGNIKTKSVTKTATVCSLVSFSVHGSSLVKRCQTGMVPKTATDPSRQKQNHGGKPTPGTLKENGSMGVVHHG